MSDARETEEFHGMSLDNIPVGTGESVPDQIARAMRDLMLQNRQRLPDGGEEVRIGALAILAVVKQDGEPHCHVAQVTNPGLLPYKAELIQGLMQTATDLAVELGVRVDVIGIPAGGGAAPGEASS